MTHTIETEQSKTTANCAVYDAASTGTQEIVGMYVNTDVFSGDPFEYSQVIVGGDEGLEVHHNRTTSNYEVYESSGGAIQGVYLHKSLFDGDAPESVMLAITEGDEATFEESAEVDEEEVESLVAGD